MPLPRGQGQTGHMRISQTKIISIHPFMDGGCAPRTGQCLTEKKTCSGTSFPKKARGHSMCSTMVGGGWQLAVGGWRLAAVDGWQLATGGWWRHGGATTTGPDATYPPAIFQNSGGGGAELGGGPAGGRGGSGWGSGGVLPGVWGGVLPGVGGGGLAGVRGASDGVMGGG